MTLTLSCIHTLLSHDSSLLLSSLSFFLLPFSPSPTRVHHIDETIHGWDLWAIDNNHRVRMIKWVLNRRSMYFGERDQSQTSREKRNICLCQKIVTFHYQLLPRHSIHLFIHFLHSLMSYVYACQHHICVSCSMVTYVFIVLCFTCWSVAGIIICISSHANVVNRWGSNSERSSTNANDMMQVVGVEKRKRRERETDRRGHQQRSSESTHAHTNIHKHTNNSLDSKFPRKSIYAPWISLNEDKLKQE